jgi:SUN family beta-glucosidase
VSGHFPIVPASAKFDVGDEGQTVPLRTRPGVISELTCPDSNHYYQHQGKFTTAQYYINNKGVPKEDACRWNSDGSNRGNWAPSYLGVGKDTYGKTFLSIATTIDNDPINYRPLDYAVEIVSEGDGSLSGSCRLHNGAYCFTGLDGVKTCNELGCTVSTS